MTTQSLRNGGWCCCCCCRFELEGRFNDLEKLRKQPVASPAECGAGKIIKIPLQRNSGLVNPREVTKLLIWWQKFGDFSCRRGWTKGRGRDALTQTTCLLSLFKNCVSRDDRKSGEKTKSISTLDARVFTRSYRLQAAAFGAIKVVWSAERDDENTCASLSLCSRSRTLPSPSKESNWVFT